MKLPSMKLPAIKMPAGKPKEKEPPKPKPVKLKQVGKGARFKFPVISLKKRKTLLLEIGEQWLKMAAVDEGGKQKKMVFFALEPVLGLSDVEIGLKIDSVLKPKNFIPTDVIISHPTHNLTTRILMLPSTDARELKDIVDLQAVKQTPYTREEITSGFQIIESDSSGYSRVLVAIAHRDTASRYHRIAEFGKLSADRITLALEGTRNWFDLLRSKGVITKGQINLMLDVDAVTTELLIYDDDKLVYSRSLGVGAKQLAEIPEMNQNQLLSEVQRSMEAAGTDLKGERVNHVILTGADKPLKDFAALLARELNLPCEVIPPLVHFESAVSKTDIEKFDKSDASIVSLAGLSLYPSPSPINLLPSEILVRRGLEERAKDLAYMGSLLLSFVMLVSVISFVKIYKKNSYLSDLKKQFSSVKKDAEEVERLVAKMKLSSDMSSGESFLDVFKEINELLPDNMTLTSVQYNDKERNVTIRGLSEEMSAVFAFLTTLEGAPHLQQVKTRNVTKRKVAEKDMADFEMVAEITHSDKPRTAGPTVDPSAPPPAESSPASVPPPGDSAPAPVPQPPSPPAESTPAAAPAESSSAPANPGGPS